jgi:hypothetical protein
MEEDAAESKDPDRLSGRHTNVGGNPAGMADEATLVREPDVVALRSPLDGQLVRPEGIGLAIDDLRVRIRPEVRKVDQLHGDECNPGGGAAEAQ